MISVIPAPFVDTRAADLALTLSEPALPAVAVRALELEDVHVELRLLGASHQVAVRRDDHELIETLACLPSGPTALPESLRARDPLGDYSTSVTVRMLTADELTRTVERLLERYADDDRYVIGLFPGHPLATTGIGLTDSGPDTVAWRSWHSYPQELRLVLTDSLLQLRVSDRIPQGVAG